MSRHGNQHRNQQRQQWRENAKQHPELVQPRNICVPDARLENIDRLWRKGLRGEA